ncbi:hypothetical protein CcaverHIS002_0306330 [Cutaneotrichosporon cavernicola]|uniref:Uncharacterized protein n=1 Tax=Cutaneotrichosporon cavernicola TaxID=279322 RepID=A0AA48IJ08_9TREE|nr:uncharacterized protein CcaverHIS019_0306280 [Cutaneotrichosporon cavernicola]BEI82765.1 hypothetical protein CcaverHIS002_0306330 [Cutaneotrichosporon cavernicola]BEI90558.1 hypothetical protein CcaverHIS019_0306280 [Cutaneotrichosporon cavernicola]BEI98332.1 hypothetical protein CcaverHIS631_0306310 [Cutaneotrichosporon cavernicola]BEJ06108.1 hypothetical protein CcaverHIS641_0306300 [Cutaneotrichosporon cavernicola]
MPAASTISNSPAESPIKPHSWSPASLRVYTLILDASSPMFPYGWTPEGLNDTSRSNSSILSFLGTGVTVKGSAQPNTTYQLTNPNDTHQSLLEPEGDVLLNSSGSDKLLQALSFEPIPTVTSVVISSTMDVDDPNRPENLDTIPLVDEVDGNHTLTSDAKVTFTGSTINGDVVYLAENNAIEIKLPSNTTRVMVLGVTDPDFGTYRASLITKNPDTDVNTFNSSAYRSEKNPNEQPYYDITLDPQQDSVYSVKVLADGKGIGLKTVKIWYSTKDKPEDVKTGKNAVGKNKSNHIGPIVGGVVGGVAAVAIVGGLFLWFRRRKQQDDKLAYRRVVPFTGGAAHPSDPVTAEVGTPGSLNVSSPQLNATSMRGVNVPVAAAPLLVDGSSVDSNMHVPPLSATGNISVKEELPVYDTSWKSTASGDEKPKQRGFIPRRRSQRSVASTDSSVYGSDVEEDTHLRVGDSRTRVSRSHRSSSSKRPGK